MPLRLLASLSALCLPVSADPQRLVELHVVQPAAAAHQRSIVVDKFWQFFNHLLAHMNRYRKDISSGRAARINRDNSVDDIKYSLKLTTPNTIRIDGQTDATVT